MPETAFVCLSHGLHARYIVYAPQFEPLSRRFRVVLILPPKVLVTANCGTETFEVRRLRCAHRHAVPSLAIIPSRDNLSSRGVIGEKPKHLAV